MSDVRVAEAHPRHYATALSEDDGIEGLDLVLHNERGYDL